MDMDINTIILLSILVVSIYYLKDSFEPYHQINMQIRNHHIYNNDIIEMPIYVINLEHRKDRLKRIKEELSKINLSDESNNLHIINAINGKNLDIKQLKNAGYLKYDSRPLRSGEIGCFMSHLDCWVKILESGQPYGLIIEDDAILTPEFVSRFNEIFDSALEYDWDVFCLGRRCIETTYGSGCKNSISLNNDLCIYEIPGYGTYGYIVNAKSIEKIMSYIFPINVPIDVLLIDLHRDKKINIISTKNNIIKQRNHTDSDTVRIK
jgi:glycosyl transferase, family 25